MSNPLSNDNTSSLAPRSGSLDMASIILIIGLIAIGLMFLFPKKECSFRSSAISRWFDCGDLTDSEKDKALKRVDVAKTVMNISGISVVTAAGYFLLRRRKHQKS